MATLRFLSDYTDPAGCTHPVPEGGTCETCPRPGEIERLKQFSQPPQSRYSLAELKQLAREFADTRCGPQQLLISERLQLSVFLAWLAKREQGEVRGR